MAKDTYYRQCRLCKILDKNHVLEQVSYIPEPYCVVGKVLRLRENDIWDDGWTVVTAGSRQPESLLDGIHTAWRKHAQYSDI